MPEVETEGREIPPVVTFTSGAKLLVDLKIVERMGREGVRRVAERDPNWPFGEGRAHPYGKLANALTMDTAAFLEFFRKREIKRRGPDKEPRQRKEAPAEEPPIEG